MDAPDLIFVAGGRAVADLAVDELSLFMLVHCSGGRVQESLKVLLPFPFFPPWIRLPSLIIDKYISKIYQPSAIAYLELFDESS